MRPAAAVPAGREIVIDGLASNVWQVSVDGAVQPGTTVEVEPGDTVEWRVGAGFHGVTFQEGSEAEAFLAFETGVGLPIVAQPAFGPAARGTAGAAAGTLLARAEVLEQATLDMLAFICTIHGPPMNGTLELAEAAPAGRAIEVVGQAGNVWQISVDGAVQPGTTVTV